MCELVRSPDVPPLCSEFLDLVNDCLGFQLLLLLLWWWLIEAARVSVVLLEKPTDQCRLDTKLDGNVVVAALCAVDGLYDPLHSHVADLTLVKSLEPGKRVRAVEGNGINVWLRPVLLPGVRSPQ